MRSAAVRARWSIALAGLILAASGRIEAGFISAFFQDTFTSPLAPTLGTGPPGGAGGSFNLTSLGTLDWYHYASGSRKVGGSMFDSPNLGGALQSSYGNEPYQFSWTNGIPTDVATNNTSGLGIFGANPAFNLHAASSNTLLRRLTLFVGGYNSVEQLTVSLNGTTPYTDTFGGGANNLFSRIYVIDYLSDAPSDLLTIDWHRISTDFDGKADLTAAYLSPSPAPEPSSIVLVGIGLAAAARRAKSRRQTGPSAPGLHVRQLTV